MRIDVDGVAIEVGDHGSGPAVLLIHGWPDSGDLWRNQVTALVEAGYRALVPDLRGFGASDHPEGVDAYNLLHLIGDMVAVLDHAGAERAHVVGHDWGAAIGWSLAAFVPDRVASLAALSVGHPASFAAAGLEQRQLSWYMLLFQFEGVAERWLSDDDFAGFRQWAGHPDHAAVTTRLQEPGALTASLNLYRANLPPEALLGPPVELPPIGCPTLGIWSSGDMALTERQMVGSAEHVKEPWRYQRVEGAGHWLQLEAPDTVNRLLLEHLGTAEGSEV
jgi:pimeloyl-ACP methyl ester carboxylesterase